MFTQTVKGKLFFKFFRHNYLSSGFFNFVNFWMKMIKKKNVYLSEKNCTRPNKQERKVLFATTEIAVKTTTIKESDWTQFY